MEYLSVYVIFYFFHQCLTVFCVQLLVSLGRFISRYFILYVAVINGLDSLIPPSDISLFMYRNASDFCVLIFVSATFLNH